MEETKELKYYNLDKIILVTIKDKYLVNYKYLPAKLFKFLWLIPISKDPFFVTYNEGWYKHGEYGYNGYNHIYDEKLEDHLEIKNSTGVTELYRKAHVVIHFQDKKIFEKYFDTFGDAEKFLNTNVNRIFTDPLKYKVLS